MRPSSTRFSNVSLVSSQWNYWNQQHYSSSGKLKGMLLMARTLIKMSVIVRGFYPKPYGVKNTNVISTVWLPNKPGQANAVTGNISKFPFCPRFKQTMWMLRNVPSRVFCESMLLRNVSLKMSKHHPTFSNECAKGRCSRVKYCYGNYHHTWFFTTETTSKFNQHRCISNWFK